MATWGLSSSCYICWLIMRGILIFLLYALWWLFHDRLYEAIASYGEVPHGPANMTKHIHLPYSISKKTGQYPKLPGHYQPKTWPISNKPLINIQEIPDQYPKTPGSISKKLWSTYKKIFNIPPRRWSSSKELLIDIQKKPDQYLTSPRPISKKWSISRKPLINTLEPPEQYPNKMIYLFPNITSNIQKDPDQYPKTPWPIIPKHHNQQLPPNKHQNQQQPVWYTTCAVGCHHGIQEPWGTWRTKPWATNKWWARPHNPLQELAECVSDRRQCFFLFKVGKRTSKTVHLDTNPI